jgi:hypothetical protein
MLDEYLVQTCDLVTIIKDEYGDYTESTTTSLPCRFREISTVRRSSHAELRDADAMVWFTANSGVSVADVIKFDGIHYQIERLTKARRLGESEVQFIKCDVKVIAIS